MFFRRLAAIVSLVIALALCGCGKKAPIESPSATLSESGSAGTTTLNSALQASKPATDELKAEHGENKADHRKGRGRADRIAVLADTLGLSEEQVTALEALQEAYAADVKALVDSTRTSGDRTDFREKMQALKQDFEADFNAILTDEQKARLEEIKAAARERAGERSRRGRRHARGGGKDE